MCVWDDDRWTVRLRGYKPEDYLAFERDRAGMRILGAMEHPEKIARVLASGVNGTVIKTNGREERVIGCGGVYRLWKGTGEAWLVASDEKATIPLATCKSTILILRSAVQLMNLVRIQTVVDATEPLNIKWAEWLGFRYEGLMKKFINGRDYMRYAVIFKEAGKWQRP